MEVLENVEQLVEHRTELLGAQGILVEHPLVRGASLDVFHDQEVVPRLLDRETVMELGNAGVIESLMISRSLSVSSGSSSG